MPRLLSLPLRPGFRAGLLSVCLAVLGVSGVLGGSAAEAQTGVVISQIFGGNGASAPYNQDFVELFNPTSSPVNLNGWGVQYASATGTSYSVAFLPGVSLAPGQYFLVGLANSTGGTSLPAPDYTYTNINLSGTAGKVYLTNSTTALTSSVVNGCPVSSTIVDYVGFGSTATCFRGSGPAPVITSSQAEVKSPLCSPAASNATDFMAGTPVAHNMASALATCGGAATLGATGVATPGSVYQGMTTLLTVAVTPASSPASTGVTVVADLSAIGGSATQPFYDDGTNGDAAAGDGVYSYLAAVSSNTAAGTKSLSATATDAQARTASAAIVVSVAVPPAMVSVRQIQSAKPSPYAGQTITTTGLVESVKTNGFYLLAPDADAAPTTPEGVLVYTGSAPPASVAVGTVLTVTGVVATYPTTGKTPGTEIDSPTGYTVVQTGVALPAPIAITAAMDSPAGGINQFSAYEGMRVSIASLTTTSGTDASLNESTETNTSNGQFFGVLTGVPRPFREPGISALESALPANVTLCSIGVTPSNCIPQWDANPELIAIDSKASGGGAIDLTSNTTVTGIVGVMDFSSGGPMVVLDRTTRPTVSGGMTVTPVPAKAATEFTVASFNMERFYNDVADADNPGSSAVTVTTAAYGRRLAKASLAIRNVLLMPDVIGTQEIENLPVLTDLANRISADAQAAGQADPVYKPYLFLATDGTAINTGMLVKSTTVDTVRAEQFGLATTFTNVTGAQAVLNDRTPLVVHVGVKRAGMDDFPVTVISVHQRSLISVDDTTNTGATVRLKREAQAEYLAKLIQGYQAAGEHVVTVGDYNSFEFSDGYVDALGVTRGTPVPASQVATPPAAGLANPPLVDLVTTLPAAERQSYVENGSAQVLDHVVVTTDLAALNTRLVYAHIDSDFPLVNLNDATSPTRISDHDPAVAYFTIPAPALTIGGASTAFGSQLISSTTTRALTLTNSGNDVLLIGGIGVTGTGYTQANACGGSLAAGASCTVNVTFAPTASGTANGTLTITTNEPGGTRAVALTGSGGDLTLASNVPTLTIVSGSTATYQITATSVGGYAGTLTFACSGLTTGESCTVGPTATLAANGTATVSLSVSTTPRTGSLVRSGPVAEGPSPGSPRQRGGGALDGAAAIAGLLAFAGMRRTRMGWRALGLLVGVSGALLLGGCSGSPSKSNNPNGTPAATQTITVTATSAGVTRTTTVALVVQ